MTVFIGRYAHDPSNLEDLPDIAQKTDNESMKTLFKTTFLFALLFTVSCNGPEAPDSTSESESSEQLTDLEAQGANETVSGVKAKKKDIAFTIDGEEATCEPMSGEKVCTEIFSIEDQFAAKCRDEGHKVIQCDCHKYLCQTKDGRPMPFDQM